MEIGLFAIVAYLVLKFYLGSQTSEKPRPPVTDADIKRQHDQDLYL